MKVETVSFVFTRPELDALMALMGYGPIPRWKPDPESVPEGTASLEEQMLVVRTGERVTVDKISAFLAWLIARPAYMCVSGESVYWGLFYSEHASAFLRLRGGRWTVTPYETFESARDAAVSEAPGFSEGLTLTVHRPGEGRDCTYSGEGAPEGLLRRASEWVRGERFPEGKEDDPWKQ